MTGHRAPGGPLSRRGFLRTAAVGGSAALTAGLPVASAAAGPSPAAGGRVLTGIEMLDRDGYELLRGQRAGLISNPTGILPDLRHEIDVVVGAGKVDLVAAFGPEHGFRGSSQAGGSEGDYVDPRTGVPVYDTYGKGPAQIADFYRDARVETVVLDRPNPVGGVDASGPVLHPEQASFVGRKPISQRHGMTVGELAGFFNGEFLPADEAADGPVPLSVVRMERWRRDMTFEQTGLPWVMPSPNMPRVETAAVYPGTCLFTGEATVDFDLWYDTEEGSDILTLETPTDGGETWQPVPFSLGRGAGASATDGTVSGFGGRVWHQVTAVLPVPAGPRLLRWRYRTDALYQGRGVYVGQVAVRGPAGERLDDPETLPPTAGRPSVIEQP